MQSITPIKIVLPFGINLPWEYEDEGATPIFDVDMTKLSDRYRVTIDARNGQLQLVSPKGTEVLIFQLSACIVYGKVGDIIPASRIVSQ